MRQEWIKSEGAADQMNHAAQCYSNKFHSELANAWLCLDMETTTINYDHYYLLTSEQDNTV